MHVVRVEPLKLYGIAGLEVQWLARQHLVDSHVVAATDANTHLIGASARSAAGKRWLIGGLLGLQRLRLLGEEQALARRIGGSLRGGGLVVRHHSHRAGHVGVDPAQEGIFARRRIEANLPVSRRRIPGAVQAWDWPGDFNIVTAAVGTQRLLQGGYAADWRAVRIVGHGAAALGTSARDREVRRPQSNLPHATTGRRSRVQGVGKRDGVRGAAGGVGWSDTDNVE